MFTARPFGARPLSPEPTEEQKEPTKVDRQRPSYDSPEPPRSGRLPAFTLGLPRVVELDEGDRLRLDCSVEGLPKAMGMLCFICFFYWSPTISAYLQGWVSMMINSVDFSVATYAIVCQPFLAI